MKQVSLFFLLMLISLMTAMGQKDKAQSDDKAQMEAMKQMMAAMLGRLK